MAWRGRTLGLLLASSSTAALLIGGRVPAFAACYSGPFPNADVGNQTGVCIANTTFSGNVGSSGTISPNGIVVINSSIGGTISDSGTLAGGIVIIDNTSIITSPGAGIFVDGPLLQGGIQNAGQVAGSGSGIHIRSASFSGSIVNSAGGTISAANANGIYLDQVGTFTGGISNAGLISSNQNGIRLSTVVVFGTNSAGGGIVNSGTISAAGINGTGIFVNKVSTFLGGVTNSGTIAASRVGISTNAATFTGGIVNSGSGLIATTHTGIFVSQGQTFAGGVSNAGTVTVSNAGAAVRVGFTLFGSFQLSNFSGGITNSGILSAAGGDGILVRGASTFSGGIVNNHGSIAAGTNGIQLGLSCSHGCVGVSTFAGGITNSGSIAASGFGIAAMAVETFSNGILNGGTISANIGIGVGFVRPSHPPTTTSFVMAPVATFKGGVTNTGMITAGSAGIWVMATSSFAGGITNAANGVIAAQNGIRVGFALTSSGANAVSNFSGGITNHGQITAGVSGVSVGNVSTFGGGISNSGTIVAHSGGGIHVDTVGTFSGGISNSGAILGNGVLSKSRASIYVGSVTAFEGGITNSGTISAGPLNGISVEFVNTFSGGISNSGSIQGDATVTKRIGVIHLEVDVFSGGITNSGTLTGVNGGIYVLAGTFLGGITNSGRITAQTGIIVDSVASFGGHIANSGTINASSTAIDLTRAATAITIDQTAGLIAGNILLSPHGDTLNVAGGTINGNVVGQNNADTVNFALGAGSFTYAAPFAMTGLDQVNFDSGTVFVDGSIAATALAVNSGATAGGTGTLAGAVTVMAGGTLMPGNLATPLGTLNIAGSLTFNTSSFYSVHVWQAAASAITIGGAPGTATISGGIVKVTLLQAGSYNQTYTIVTATGGRSGTFAGISNTNAGFAGTEALSYDATHVFLTLSGTATLGSVSLVAPGPLSTNPQNVLNGINNFIAPGNVLPGSFQNLYALSGPTLLTALSQLSGQNSAGFFQGAFQAGNSFLGLMVNPFVDGRFGNGGGAAIGFAPDAPPALPQAAAAFASAMPEKAPPPAFDQRFNAWGAAYGGSGNVRGDPVIGSSTTTASVAAFAAGIDYRASRDTTFGFALAGGGTNWSLDTSLGGGRSDFFQAGLYGSQRWGNAYLSGALAYNFHDVTTNRTVTIAGTDMLQARFQANGVGARLEGGYRYATPWLGVTPYAAAQVQSIFLPRYAESATAGSNQFALSFASQTATATRTEIGTWLDRTTLLERGARMTLYGRLAWAHDFGDTPSASAIFQVLPGSNFVVNGATPARDGGLVTAGAKYELTNGWSFTAKFDGEFSSTTSIYSGSGMVQKTW